MGMGQPLCLPTPQQKDRELLLLWLLLSATVLWWSYRSKPRNKKQTLDSVFLVCLSHFFCPCLSDTYSCALFFSPEACGSKSVYDGPEEEEYSTFIIDDPKETYKTLKLIIEGVGTLEQEHAQYKRDKFKKTKYGSQ